MTKKNNVWRIIQMLVIALMVAATTNSIWELRASAAGQDPKNPEYCSGMMCFTAGDCGESCFCNKNDSTCYRVIQ
jgi:hypothetical protein